MSSRSVRRHPGWDACYDGSSRLIHEANEGVLFIDEYPISVEICRGIILTCDARRGVPIMEGIQSARASLR